MEHNLRREHFKQVKGVCDECCFQTGKELCLDVCFEWGCTAGHHWQFVGMTERAVLQTHAEWLKTAIHNNIGSVRQAYEKAYSELCETAKDFGLNLPELTQNEQQ